MPALDLITVKVVTLLTMFMISLATSLAWGALRKAPGMHLFGLGLIALFLGGAAGLSRFDVPGPGPLIAYQILTFAGVAAVAQAVRRFRGFPPIPKAALGTLGAAAFGAFICYLFCRDSLAARVAIVSASLSVLCADAAASMVREVPARDRAVYWPTAGAFALAVANFVIRAVGALSGHYGPDLFDAGPVEIQSTILSLLAYIGATFGMVLCANSRLRHESEMMALFDPLTGLPNRRQLLDRLAIAEQRAAASGRKLGLIYLDLDGFKGVNDMLGHAIGDDLLRRAGNAMMDALRTGDCLARVGGDEFVVLVESAATRAEVITISDRVRAAVEAEPISEEFPWRLRVSCGVAMFPDDGTTMEEVMREADLLMYEAKRRSRAEREAMAT